MHVSMDSVGVPLMACLALSMITGQLLEKKFSLYLDIECKAIE